MTDVAVGRIVKAHGVKGEVAVEVRTDTPDARFFVGAELQLEKGHESLTVAAVRWHQGRLLVSFEEVRDRTDAEALAGSVLTIDVDPDEATGDPEEFYDHQLVGLRAETEDGVDIGSVADVVHVPGQELLVLDTVGGERIVPFVAALVPQVDLGGGRIVVARLEGLLDDVQDDTA
ncbi:MAG: ribosome maturation factor RimM [Propionibacteriaceae bacterium]|jgi:16S rRNA processing protein RimM|nr:ribosome maturation factor RimM [Propionibacteriaceae bacterium]